MSEQSGTSVGDLLTESQVSIVKNAVDEVSPISEKVGESDSIYSISGGGSMDEGWKFTVFQRTSIVSTSQVWCKVFSVTWRGNEKPKVTQLEEQWEDRFPTP